MRKDTQPHSDKRVAIVHRQLSPCGDLATFKMEGVLEEPILKS